MEISVFSQGLFGYGRFSDKFSYVNKPPCWVYNWYLLRKVYRKQCMCKITLLQISNHILIIPCNDRHYIHQWTKMYLDAVLLLNGTVRSHQLAKLRREEGLLRNSKAKSLSEFTLCSVPQLLMNKSFFSIEMQSWKESKETSNLFILFLQPWQWVNILYMYPMLNSS